MWIKNICRAGLQLLINHSLLILRTSALDSQIKFQNAIRNSLAFRNPAFRMSGWFRILKWWMQSRERCMVT
ncbi:uncharacterized protein OCT59_024928 [Rhizophagus irregularis]|uniref:uncharacterized protein n=1 Tax=Rhizophagus irregularis TaxID=588596 RepID=UPI00331D259E|nr:hypothetical protein OCT59_024928 [Rhizophagus irregularis]